MLQRNVHLQRWGNSYPGWDEYRGKETELVHLFTLPPAQCLPGISFSQVSLFQEKWSLQICIIDCEYLTIVFGFQLLSMKQPFCRTCKFTFLISDVENKMAGHFSGRKPSRIDILQKRFFPSFLQHIAYLVAWKFCLFLNSPSPWMVVKNHCILWAGRGLLITGSLIYYTDDVIELWALNGLLNVPRMPDRAGTRCQVTCPSISLR